ncbi:VOC family protein [Pseudochelatococcus sp. G4_1912]|uniref:VOC family protein n=1 Tax=Pseudochelatococcus sp. G4_1912 TaxID=3114288 RepID=UPI0039C60087
MGDGLHHITAITSRVQANIDFYAGFLGLRLVKQTGGFEDARQLHLFYGDRAGSPGSLLTFLVWEGGSRGRVGHGQTNEIALAIAPTSIGFWLTRALAHNLRPEGPSRVFNETVLRFRDPDGIAITLTGCSLPSALPWTADDIPAEHAITRIRGAQILSEMPEQTARFITHHFGYQALATEGDTQRLVSSSGDVIDIRNAQGFWPQGPGTGTIDHLAFRAPDTEHVMQMEAELKRLNNSDTNVHDRRYFTSLYVREPGGVLLELATDEPGFTIDESIEMLGATLMTPPMTEEDAADIRIMLPQFSRPGEYRMHHHELPFMHRFHTPDNAGDTTIVLLHGTGGNEADLMPLAHRLAPHARLLGVRGRSNEEGVQRWFRRTSATSFDQADIRNEAEAFAAFITGANAAYGLDPAKTIYLGYSNGANLLGALLSLHPHLVHHAILLRGIAVLDEPPTADLSDVSVLLLSGDHDPYAKFAPALERTLIKGGAKLDTRQINAGHELSDQDIDIAKAWITSAV